MERFSESEKTELWDRFEAGELLRSISRQLGRAPSSVRTHVVAAGWWRPVPAADRCPVRSWTQAWKASDADAFAAIYASGAQRHDALAGSRTGDEIAAWSQDLLATHPEATIDVADVYTSTRGPAAVYTLNASARGGPCAMTILTVWNLDESGLITDEFIHYDPETMLACGWTS